MTPARPMPQTLGEMMTDILLALDRLVVGASENVTAVAALTRAMDHRPTRKETGWFLAAVMTVLVLVNVAAISAVVVVLRQGQQQIESCVTPQGKCAEDGHRRTAEAVASIQCVPILLAGQRPAGCEDTARRLVSSGVHLPG